MVGGAGTAEHDDVAYVRTWYLVAPDPDRDPLLVGDVNRQVTPVEWLTAVGWTEVLADYEARVSLGHVSSFADHPSTPLHPSS